jgi:ribonuclease HI
VAPRALAAKEGSEVSAGNRRAGGPSSARGVARVGVPLSRDDSVFGGTAADVVDPDAIHIWADGACSGNPGPAGSGTVLVQGQRRREISTWLGEGTNNVAELTAVLQGLRALKRPVRRPLVVHTDSQYSIGVLARGWKAKANQELVAEIRTEIAGIPRVVWHWIRGHDGVVLNERADALARRAVETRRSDEELVSP